MIDHNMETFGEQRLGIHGHELPKYMNKDKEWWKWEKGYNLSPRYESHAQMMLDRGKWSKNDKFKITDFTGDDAPVDDFK